MTIFFIKKIIVLGIIGMITFCAGFSGLGKLLLKSIDEEKSFSFDDIDNIEVNMSVYPVHIIRSEAGSNIKFHLYGQNIQKISLITQVSQKTLHVATKREFLFNTPGSLFLDIYVPENYKKNLSIDIATGRVKSDSIELTSFVLNTSTGGLDAENINAKDISIHTTTGRIDINQIDANDLEIVGTTAGINIEECYAEIAKIRTSTGSINIGKMDTKELVLSGTTSGVGIDECVVETAKINTTTGSITVKNSKGNFDLGSGTGRIVLEYNEFVEQDVTIEATTGNISLQLPDKAEFSLKANSSTGNIHSDFPVSNTASNELTGQVGMTNNSVVLKTTTGNINIIKK